MSSNPLNDCTFKFHLYFFFFFSSKLIHFLNLYKPMHIIHSKVSTLRHTLILIINDTRDKILLTVAHKHANTYLLAQNIINISFQFFSLKSIPLQGKGQSPSKAKNQDPKNTINNYYKIINPSELF